MNRIKVPKFLGIDKSVSARNLPNEFLSDGSNIIFENDRIKTRWGYSEIGSNLPFDETVTCVAEYKELRGDETTKIACTANNIYAYNDSSTLWETISPSYNTGTVTWPTTTSSVQFESGQSHYTSICSPASNKIVIAYSDANDSSIGKCRAGTVADNGVITWGAIVTFEAGATNYVSICSPDTDKIAIVFQDDNDSDKGKCIVGTLSGTVITINLADVKDFESGTTLYSSICSPDTDKIAIAYRDSGDSGKGKCIVGSISGTTITFGAIEEFHSTSTASGESICSPDTDKIAIAYNDGGDGYKGKCVVNTISGTTLGTWGTVSEFESGATGVGSICSSDTNKIAIVYRDGDDGGKGKCIVGSISGTTIAFGAIEEFESGTALFSSICSPDTNKIAIAYNDDDDDDKGKYIAGSISGTTITFGPIIQFDSGQNSYQSICSYNTERIAISYNNILPTGDGECVVANLGVEGSGTTWSALWPTDTYEIKFGTTDLDGTGSPDVWYTIGSFADTDSLYVNTYLSSVQSGVTYVIRQNFTSTSSDYFDTTNIVEDLTAQNEWLIITNNVELPVYYAGSGTSSTLGGNPPYGKLCMVYYGHLLLGNCKDNSTEASLPQSIYWSARGEPETWTGSSSGFVDLLDNDDEITGMEILKERAFIFKKKSIVTCAYTGQSDPAFIFTEDMITEVGCPSGRTIVNTGREIIFLSSDNIYSFNGFEVIPVGFPIKDDLLSNLNETYDYKSHAFNMPTKNLYCLFITSDSDINPDLVYVYNYDKKTWTIWEFADNITASCVLKDDTIMIGDSAGYVYNIDFTDIDDNGTDIVATIDTKDFEFISQQVGAFTARINETIVRMRDNSGSAQISASIDHGNTWSLPITIYHDITEEVKDHIQNWFLRSRNVIFKIENVSGSQVEIESFEIGIEKSGINRR